MKIFIMTDMEAVAGVLDHDSWVMRDGIFYQQGLRLCTEEVNAAIDGFFTAGATEILVVDGHGAGGINPELLDPRAFLARGRAEKIWPWTMDQSYDALAFVGQHAKAGTPYSHITHTGWFDVIDLSINGLSIGEYGQLSLCAMELGVPTILACGEEALCKEAEALTPGVFTVSGKRGLLPDGLDHLDSEGYRKAKLGAIHRSPTVVREEIREQAALSLRRLQNDPLSFRYPDLKPPFKRVAKFRPHKGNPARECTDEHPDSIIGLLNQRLS